MKYAFLASRFVLGAILFIFGLNGFTGILPMPSMKELPEFIQLLYISGYITPIKLLEMIAGLIFLSGRFIPLGISLSTPIIVNVLMYHIVFDVKNIAMPVVMLASVSVLIYQHWGLFSQFLMQRHPSAEHHEQTMV